MKAVILAGGFGTRLSEETDRIPKPMVEIGGRPMLWHIMKAYSHYGIIDFVICLGYKGYVIKEFFMNYSLHLSDVTMNIQTGEMNVHHNPAEPWCVTLIETGLDTQTGGRLKRVSDHVKDATFCLTYGDGFSDISIAELVAFHQSHKKLATVTGVAAPGRFGALEVEANKVTGFREKPLDHQSMINGGFFVFEPAVLEYLEGDHTILERDPLEKLAQGGELMVYPHKGFWQCVDTLREKRILDELWNSGKAQWKVWDK